MTSWAATTIRIRSNKPNRQARSDRVNHSLLDLFAFSTIVSDGAAVVAITLFSEFAGYRGAFRVCPKNVFICCYSLVRVTQS